MNFPIVEFERIRHRMSRTDLATTLGVSRRTIQNWQNGATEIPLSKLLKMAEIWNCSTDYLLGLDVGRTN